MKKIFFIVVGLALFLGCSSDDAPDNNQNIEIDRTANLQTTGSSSEDLLSDETFTSILVELVYVQGFRPSQTAINNFVSFLEERINKPEGIDIETRAIPSPGLSPYTIEEIVDIEAENRTRFNDGNQIAVWAFFADGNADGDTNREFTLGTAYRNTSFVIYQNTVQRLSGGSFQPSQSVLESAVIHHEFSHIFGLVNLGAPLQSEHEDTENPRHCNVPGCLMQASAETGAGMMEMVTGGTTPVLDPQCIADLRANGGR